MNSCNKNKEKLVSITHYENEYHIFDKNAKTRGVYTKDGNLLRGDAVLPAGEARYRIWRQTQLPEISDKLLKKMYESYLIAQELAKE